MKTLVTGAQGFLGRAVAEQLRAAGHAVRGLVRRPAPELEAAGIETVRGDLADEAATIAACAGVDAVFHVGAIAGIWGRWADYEATNVRGTDVVLAGCRKHDVRKLVYTSSPSVTFGGQDQCNTDESAPYPERWLAWYPKSKALAERAVLAANNTPTAGGATLRTCALRPHLIWGPRDGHLVPRLLDRARRGRLRKLGDGRNKIDMVYVDNAARAHLLAAERLTDGSPVCGKPFFITQQEPVYCWDWIDEILALAGLPPVKRRLPTTAAYLIGGCLEGLWTVLGRTDEPPMTRFLARQLGTHHYFDPTRARVDLGYEPHVSTAEGMRRLGDWIRAEKI